MENSIVNRWKIHQNNFPFLCKDQGDSLSVFLSFLVINNGELQLIVGVLIKNEVFQCNGNGENKKMGKHFLSIFNEKANLSERKLSMKNLE